MKLAAALLGAVALAVTPLDRAASYVEARQQPNGAFAEAGGNADPALTAWAVLALRAAGRPPERLGKAAEYLAAARAAPATTDIALRILALTALGEDASAFVTRLESQRKLDGSIGGFVNSTAWGVLALRAAGRPVGATTVRYLLRQQRKSGGWPWHPSGSADSNDTAAVIQALRSAGVPGRSQAIRLGVTYLRRLQRPDGGFPLVPGRSSDSQSTAWAAQAFLAAGRKPGAALYRFLVRMRRADGSYRYSARYALTPVWVTAQVLPALAGAPFPLRRPGS
jgi:hypothetical protein